MKSHYEAQITSIQEHHEKLARGLQTNLGDRVLSMHQDYLKEVEKTTKYFKEVATR
jgi:hypothetical protein